MKYADYLRSPQWKEKRRQRMSIDNFTCQGCLEGGTPFNPLDVHHLTYENLFDEPMRDLITLCRGCHGGEHGRPVSDRLKRRQEREEERIRQDDQVVRIFGR